MLVSHHYQGGSKILEMGGSGWVAMEASAKCTKHMGHAPPGKF